MQGRTGSRRCIIRGQLRPVNQTGPLIFVLLFACVTGGVFAWNAVVEKKRLEAECGQAITYAKDHPADVNGSLSRLKDARKKVIGRNAAMERRMDSEILALENMRAAQEERFEQELKELDRKAGLLVREHRYKEAMEVYGLGKAGSDRR